MKRILGCAILGCVAATAQAADDIDALQNLNQDEFRLFSEDLGAALSYKAVAPAEPLGITGFDVGVEITATSLKNDQTFDKASAEGGLSTLPLAKLHAHKGLPFGIDVGAFYASVPSTNISLIGAELRYALIEGGIAIPAVAVRGTYSRLNGVDQLDLDTKGLELSISKGFAMLTPYAGVGQIWVTSTPKAEAVTPGNLTEESFTQTKYYLGANLNLGLLNFAVEGDKTGDASTYGAKLGFRF